MSLQTITISWTYYAKDTVEIEFLDVIPNSRQKLEKNAVGHWTVDVALAPGSHKFRFLIDFQVRFSYAYTQVADENDLIGNVILVTDPDSIVPPKEPKLVKEVYRWTSQVSSQLEKWAFMEEEFLNNVYMQPPLLPLPPPIPSLLERVVLNHPGYAAFPPTVPPPMIDAREQRRNLNSPQGTAITRSPSRAKSKPSQQDPAPNKPDDRAKLEKVDEKSTLPIPNPVVLHHLTASAINVGVLAVGCTTRYKNKFCSVIFYKQSGSGGYNKVP